MKRRVMDKSVWIVALSALLTLSGASFLFCPTARAGSDVTPASDQVPTEAAHTALTLQADDDGDELLEHWGAPQYSREERLQIGGIVVLLTCAGGASAYKRRSLRRAAPHD
jgi:hypothetical protein